MDTSTVTFIAGVIVCIIGILTFVSGRMEKAERNGALETKINQALDGISSINQKLETSVTSQHNLDLMVRSHDEQLKSLEKAVEDGNKTREVLIELLQAIKSMTKG
jgi:septal ring factor EnvC (AmiA/AmiB activator)